MKKKLMTILPIFFMGIALTFTGCKDSVNDKKDKTEQSREDDEEFSEKALKGEWNVDNAAEALDLNDDDTFTRYDATSTIEFKGKRFNWDVNFEGTVDAEGHDIDMTMVVNIKGSYTVDGESVEMTLEDGTAKVTRVDFDDDMRAMLELQGMDVATFKQMINTQFAGSFSETISGETENFKVKNFKGDSMTLKGGDGTTLVLSR